MPFTLKMGEKVLAAAEYGDMIDALRNQIRPYENEPGAADAWSDKWIHTISGWMHANKNYTIPVMKHCFKEIARDAAKVPITRIQKVKVGVVGEIYVKFSPMGNNELKKFLEEQDCEVNMPGLMGYVNYCVKNFQMDIQLYGGNKITELGWKAALKVLDGIGVSMSKEMQACGFYGEESFYDLIKGTQGIIHLGAKMGEGWLLSGEMVSLIKGGYPNIICAQPFGCLPNHIMGKGVINTIRAKYPQANISAIDYDPSATKVNQENRIKLMLAVAKENLAKQNA